MSKNPQLAPAKSVLEFKSSSFNLPSLLLIDNKLVDIQRALEEKITQAPDLFKHSPLLIDLQELAKRAAPLDLRALISLLRKLHFLPVAITGGTDKQNALAIEMGVAIQSVQNSNYLKRTTPEPSELPVISEPIPLVENKVITQPVRSGQRVYARGDLTVLAAVNPGAEIIAEGSIHVYASLKGRALAGVLGNIHSCIFCADFQAELISIAGTYQLSDDLKTQHRHKLVQIYLQGQSLFIKEL